jgi:hypothetical protein
MEKVSTGTSGDGFFFSVPVPPHLCERSFCFAEERHDIAVREFGGCLRITPPFATAAGIKGCDLAIDEDFKSNGLDGTLARPIGPGEAAD